MEKLLLRLARQLDALDEASLMSLWSKYATITSRFEPTKRWEDACLIFSLIQAKHWKNQLFNYSWAQQRKPLRESREDMESPPPPPVFNLEPEQPEPEKKACRILAFRRPANQEQENRDEASNKDDS